MGNLWEMFKQHLPFLLPFIYRCSDHFTGDPPQFLQNSILVFFEVIVSLARFVPLGQRKKDISLFELFKLEGTSQPQLSFSLAQRFRVL